MSRNIFKISTVILAVAFSSNSLAENKLRWGLTGEAVSLDPQGRLSAVEFIFLRMAYEGLTSYDDKNGVIPGLAESWENPNPTLWKLKLREGVKFHGGEDFTSEDVVFSINRTNGETSAFKSFTKSIVSVKATGDYSVEIRTKKPDPLFLNNMTSVFIMDAGWAATNKVETAPDSKNPKKYYTDTNMNGTGPFKLSERKPDVSTTMVKNADWWGKGEFPGNLDEIESRPISNAATRVASLLAGDLDMLIDIPLPDINRVESDARLQTVSTAQLRTIFLGFNLGVDKLATSDVDGNPFKDIRVRQAVNLALNAELIKDKIMRGVSIPTAALVPPGLAGYSDEMAMRGEADLEKAKSLMTEAGYPDGFSVRLDCPNNRYLNDEAICQATVSMLAKVGIKVTLNALPKDQWNPLLTGKKSDFYLLGWGTPTNDSHFIARHIFLEGPFHSGYTNPKIAELMVAAESELDRDKRNDLLEQVFTIARDDAAIAPIHYQVITWGASKSVNLKVDPNNIPDFRYITLR